MNKECKLNRLKNYDYSQPGYYYITICVHPDLRWNNIFGKIINGKMVLNEYGEILKFVWQNLPNHYNNCLLDEYIIMPDHFHGIVTIVAEKQFQLHKKYGIPEIIRGFKTFSSRGINEMNNWGKFHWQKSYYDHIIRNNDSLIRIQKYIINNPVNWKRKTTK